jgi:ubiquinone/menaquinone biosynthesis C-methylase UbiE
MIKQIILDELTKYKDDIDNIKEEKTIDCITIFSRSDEDYIELNKELSSNKVIDEMSSGNLYYLSEPIKTIYGDLSFIKIRKHDDNYNDYRISVDFTVENYDEFKSNLINPVIKTYDTFELIQLKNEKSIINIISLSAKDDYKIYMSKWGIEEKETLAAIDELSGITLDIAAGDGRFINKLLEVSDKVIAIDINSSELAELKRNYSQNNKLQIEVVDITKEFPYEDSTFDSIFCTGTLHLFDKETINFILNEIKRVLKPGGKIVLDFATDIERLDKDGNKVVFDGEGSYSSSDAIELFNEELKDFSLNIIESSFEEANLDDNTGYNSIKGKFLVIAGSKSI